jgi:hypothetical protein
MSIFDRSGDERAARFARNQALYREVNERVQAINEAFESLLPLGDWVCECANPECSEALRDARAGLIEIADAVPVLERLCARIQAELDAVTATG